MADDSILATYLAQMATRIPVLLIYLGGMALSFTFWRRYPKPCLLLFLAMLLALLGSIVSVFAFVYVTRTMIGVANAAQVGLIINTIVVVANIVQAVALALMLAAIFVGRRRDIPPWPPEDDGPPLPTGEPADPDIRIRRSH
jgi:hypothetical protein